MPRNSYGPEDPEYRPDDGGAREILGLFQPQLPKPGAESCKFCNRAPAVTLVDVGVEAGKLVVKGACHACAQAEGERRKGEILKTHSARRTATLDWLHDEMRVLYDRRVEANPATAWVTVVDARRAYRRMPDADANADLRFMGSLFRSRGWERIEGKTEKNSDEGNHARPVDCWRYSPLGVKSK